MSHPCGRPYPPGMKAVVAMFVVAKKQKTRRPVCVVYFKQYDSKTGKLCFKLQWHQQSYNMAMSPARPGIFKFYDDENFDCECGKLIAMRTQASE